MTGKFEDLLREIGSVEALDAHLSIGQPPRLRLIGQGLVRRDDLGVITPDDMDRFEAEVLKVMSPTQSNIYSQAGAVECAMGIQGVGRFRVVLYHQRGAKAMCIEPIPKDVPSLGNLGFMPVVNETVEQALSGPGGLIIVAGPLRAGKTTAVAAMVEHINRNRAAHIIKVENPVEYLHRHILSLVHQLEIGTDVPVANRLIPAVLRRNPDVVVIDAAAELSVIGVADILKASLTGCLVIVAVEAAAPVQGLATLMRQVEEPQRHALFEQVMRVLRGTLFLTPVTNGRGHVRIDAQWFGPRESNGI